MTYWPKCGHEECKGLTACCRGFTLLNTLNTPLFVPKGFWEDCQKEQVKLEVPPPSQEYQEVVNAPYTPVSLEDMGDALAKIREELLPDLPKQVFKVAPNTLDPLLKALGLSSKNPPPYPCGVFLGIPIVVDPDLPRDCVKLEPGKELPLNPITWAPRPEIKVDNPELDRISSMELDPEASKILRDNLFDLYVTDEDLPKCICSGGDVAREWCCRTAENGYKVDDDD